MKRIKIDITRNCNGNCVYCDNPRQKRITMPLAEIKKIIDAFPEIKYIYPQWLGEPMMHPKFYEIIKYCKDKGKSVIFYTNGSLIHKHIDTLELLDKKDKVLLSVEGSTAKEFESIRRGIKWDRLIENAKMLKKVCKAQLIVRATECEEIKDINKVKTFWKQIIPHVVTKPEVPLTREVKGRYIEKKGCKQLQENITIKADGELILCCADYEGIAEMGNVFETDPRELVEKTKHLRHTDHVICKTCNFKFERL